LGLNRGKEMDSEFILVSKRKKRGKKPKISNVGCAYSPTPIECPSDIANCYQRSLANIDEYMKLNQAVSGLNLKHLGRIWRYIHM